MVTSWILDLPISDRAIRLFAILGIHARRDKQTSFPNRRTLARRLGCTVKRADLAKRELLDHGAITSEARYHPHGGQTSNLYTIRLCPPNNIKTPSVEKRPSPPVSLFDPPPVSLCDPPPASQSDPPRTRNIGTRTIEPSTPPNPLAGGRPSTRKPSKAEHDWASRVLATYRDGCPHDPTCDTRAKCIGKLVMFQRQQTLEGMTEEMNA